MRLISKFRDFYDIGSSTDREKHPLFVRDKDDIFWDVGVRIPTSHPSYAFSVKTAMKLVPWDSSLSGLGVCRTWIAMCGRALFFYRFEGRVYWTLSALLEAVSIQIQEWAAGGWKGQFGTMPTKKKAAADLDRELRFLSKGNSRWWADAPITEDAWSKFENEFELPPEFFLWAGAPIVERVSERYARTHGNEAGPEGSRRHSFAFYLRNPCLRDLGLHREWNGYEVWQEIDTYLSNDMVKQFDPAQSRTDEIARDMHGFDEWSFKNTAPGEKKQRRSENRKRKRNK